MKKNKDNIVVENNATKASKPTKRKKTLYELCFKRMFDIILSLLAIIILSPVFIVTWILHKIFIGGGRAIFVQYRPGKNGKVFKLYKFRSMTNKTDKDGNLLPDKDRITKFGKFIRKLSIDELPQLFNILKGDMSIVGPRPRVLSDVIFYDETALESCSVKPGLTGPDQVSGGRSTASWEEIFAVDVEYAKKVTFFKDLWIVLKTPFALFKGTGGGAEQSKREYFYADHLLKTGKINELQYAEGKQLAKQLATKNGKLDYQPQLHTQTMEKSSHEALPTATPKSEETNQ